MFSLSYVRAHLNTLQAAPVFNGMRPVTSLCDDKYDLHIHGPLRWEHWGAVLLGATAAVALVSLAFRKTPKRTCGIVGMLDSSGKLCAVQDLTCKVVEVAMKQGLASLVMGQGSAFTQQVLDICEEVGLH